MKEQVSKAVVCGLEIRCTEKLLKFHKETSVLESLFNKVAGLNV